MILVRLLAFALALAAPDSLATTAEKSGWTRTGRYAEVERLCPAFEKAYPGRVRCVRFGVTPERRPMLALVASDDGALTPEAARKRHRTVSLAQGGIHAGEIDGKDAGFEALVELLKERGPLSKITFVFVPVFNVDGHERFGPNNRPNQTGPEEMGWRTTPKGLNLNRDYAKCDAPEMAAMLDLLRDWDPILYADLHVTDGAQFQHDVGVVVSPDAAGAERTRPFGAALKEALLARLSKQGHKPLGFYPSFEREDDPSSGFALGMAPPRFSQGYWEARNRIGVLVETHSWKPYAVRVRVTKDVVLDLAAEAALHGGEWRDAAAAQDASDAGNPTGGVPLAWENAGGSRTIDFLGYAYERSTSAILGMVVVAYDTARPEVQRLPLQDELRPALTVEPPRGGYVVPASDADWVSAKLKRHGIRYSVLGKTYSGRRVEAYQARKVSLAAASTEGRTKAKVSGAWAEDRQDFPAGSLYVPAGQPLRRLVLELLEPAAPDSFVSWGFFNSAFERKEYMEAYVAETAARYMLARDPALKADFEKRLADDREFAANPAKRLDYFYRRHPSWDPRTDLYPVYRVDAAPAD